jgi:hypothetical protein
LDFNGKNVHEWGKKFCIELIFKKGSLGFEEQKRFDFSRGSGSGSV